MKNTSIIINDNYQKAHETIINDKNLNMLYNKKAKIYTKAGIKNITINKNNMSITYDDSSENQIKFLNTMINNRIEDLMFHVKQL